MQARPQTPRFSSVFRPPARATALLLGFLTVLPAWAQSADATLETFYKGYLDRYFQQQPLAATQLGEHRYDDRLEDLSSASRAAWLAESRNTLRELPRQVDYRKLSRDGQIDFEIFQPIDWPSSSSLPPETVKACQNFRRV